MKTIKKLLETHATGKKVLLLFLLTNLVYAAMLLITIPATMEFSNSMKLLDMMPLGYDAEYVNALFTALGQEGRDFYLYRQLPLDMIYPLLFGIGYSLLLAYFLKKVNKLNRMFFLCFLPLLAGLADYAENLGILRMLTSFPNFSNLSVQITGSFSILKSMSSTVYFFCLIGVVVTWHIQRLTRKRASLRLKKE